METTPAPAPVAHPGTNPRTTPTDFFLWLGFIVTFYGSVIALVTLIFEYINVGFPDSLTPYSDPYSTGIRFAMATLIVFGPACLYIMRTLRVSAERDETREKIWVRHWAIILTIFLSASAFLIDTVTLVDTFLSGEISTRFILKVVVVLLIAGGTFAHFIAENKGYWIRNPRKAVSVGVAAFVLCIATLISGFLIVGTPSQVRMLREDASKISDLQNIQYQVINYWQMKRALPATLGDLNDPLQNYTVPVDTQTRASYEYHVLSAQSFELCAIFNAASPAGTGLGITSAYSYDPTFVDGNLTHGVGRTCFSRTIDPVKYPPIRTEKPL